MLFEQIRSGGCLSYLIGCDETCGAMLVDPHLEQLDRYIALASERGMRIHYVCETHTHADHFSAARELGRQLDAKVVMHRLSAAPFADVRVDDGETLIVGKLRVKVMHTPGHTNDSTCLVFEDRVLTGDTLLIDGCGRTDFQSGDAGSLYDSVHERLFTLPDDTRVWPAHDYHGNTVSTIGHEMRHNARLAHRDRDAFVALMGALELPRPRLIDVAVPANRLLGISHAA